MHKLFRATALAAALSCAVLAGGAHAATIYASASFVDEAQAIGDYFIDNTRYLGAIFSVSTPEQLSAIGGNFTQFGDGNPIFGAIVPVSPGGALPGNVLSTAVAHTVFTPTGGDQSVAIIGVLNPGTYAVIFGSGVYDGATGYSGLVDSQLPIGTPSFVQYSGSGVLAASSFSDATLRVTVLAAPVPEPEMAALWAGGASMLAWAVRRRKR